MTKDCELDRLKVEQDLAYHKKQAAYEKMQQAWIKLTAKRDALNAVRQTKQSAYHELDRTWHYYQNVRNNNSPKIDALNLKQERAYENMKRAFANASSAYDKRDGASAKNYAEEGRRYKAESQSYVIERRKLVEEIRIARSGHENTKLVFSNAKRDFNISKLAFERAKAEHESAKTEFRYAKEAFERASKSFRSQLELVKAENKKRNEENRKLVIKAGVPSDYANNCWISINPSGTVNIYFGGEGRPDGPGHGHYVMDSHGKVTYRREPLEPHGAHNFTDTQETYENRITKEALSEEFGFWCRFRGYIAYVESNYANEGKAKIDIYYGPNGPFGPNHHHAVAYRDSPLNFIYDGLR